MSTILSCCKLVYEGERGVENLLILVWKSDIASQFYAPVGFQLDSITTLTTYRDFTRVIHKACGQFFGLFNLFHLVVIWICRNMYIWQTPSPAPSMFTWFTNVPQATRATTSAFQRRELPRRKWWPIKRRGCTQAQSSTCPSLHPYMGASINYVDTILRIFGRINYTKLLWDFHSNLVCCMIVENFHMCYALCNYKFVFQKKDFRC